LTDAGGSKRREIVTPPLVRNAHPHAAHANNIHDMLIVLLDFHCGKDERAFRIYIFGGAHIRSWQRVAAIGLVSLGKHGEAMDPIVVNHRDQDRMIGRMGAAMIRRVMDVSVTALQVGMILDHCTTHEFWPAKDVDWQTLRSGQELVLTGEDRA